MKIDYTEIVNNTVANILSAIIIGILGLVVFDRERKLRPWLYRLFGGTFTRFLYKLLDVIINPWLRVLIIFILLIIINLRDGDFVLSVILFLTTLSLLWRAKYDVSFLPASKKSDSFEKLDNWITKTGNPIIENDFGKPAPDLVLKHISGQATNSFVILKNTEQERGIIECDFYLEDGAIFNIVFFCDDQRHNWYMARYDSRIYFSDGLLVKDQGPGANWRVFKMSGTQTDIKRWHRAKVEYDSTRIAIYKDGVLLVEYNNPKIFGKKIGIFNELNDVHVDNFILTEK